MYTGEANGTIVGFSDGFIDGTGDGAIVGNITGIIPVPPVGGDVVGDGESLITATV